MGCDCFTGVKWYLEGGVEAGCGALNGQGRCRGGRNEEWKSGGGISVEGMEEMKTIP